MTNSEYEFGGDAQLKVLALLVREPDQALNLIEPRYFTNPIHVDIARIVKEAYAGKNLKSDRFERDSLWATVWIELKNLKGARVYDLKRPYRAVVKEIFKLHLPDKNMLLDLARKFAKEGRYRRALVEAEKDLNAGNHDSFIKRIEKLKEIDSRSSGTINLPVHHLHRFINQEEISENTDNYLVYPIIPKGGAILLYGLPKELKSWMAAGLVIDAAAGRKALGYFEVSRPVRILYIQVEDPEFLTQERLRDLYWNQGTKRPVGCLKVVPRCALNLMDAAWLGALDREIGHYRPDLIVFDVFRRLFRGNVADSEQTAEFLRILDNLRDRYGCAVLLVHHAKKSETSEIQTRALGSVNLTAWADVLLYVGGKHRIGSASISRLDIESKATMLGQDRLVIRVDSEAFPMVSVLNEEKCMLDSVLASVCENPGSNQKQLEEKSGIPEKRLRAVLRRAVDEKLLREKHGDRKSLLYFPLEED